MVFLGGKGNDGRAMALHGHGNGMATAWRQHRFSPYKLGNLEEDQGHVRKDGEATVKQSRPPGGNSLNLIQHKAPAGGEKFELGPNMRRTPGGKVGICSVE